MCCRSCRRCCPRARPAVVGGRSGSWSGSRSRSRSRSSLLAQLVKGIGLASGAARDAGGRRADRVRARAADPGSGRARAGAAVAAGAVRPQDARQRILVRARSSAARWASSARPCAGPILAAVTSVSASTRRLGPASSRSRSPTRSGSAAVMLLYGLGGRAVLDRIRRRRPRARRRAHARSGAAPHRRGDGHEPRCPLRGGAGQGHEPAGLPRRSRRGRSRTRTRSRTGSRRCDPPRGSPSARRRRPRRLRPPTQLGVAIPGVKTPSLPVLGRAPDFTENQDWFNTPGDRPLTMAGLRGHVVLVDFWTYTCINCIRTLPVRQGPVRDLSPLRARGRRGRDARVHLRAGGGQRRAGDPQRRDPLSGRPGQPATGPGTLTRTSTGRPSTSSTPTATSATPSSARATTRRTRRRSASCCSRPAPASAAADDRDARSCPHPSSARPRRTWIRSASQGFAQPLKPGVHTYSGRRQPRPQRVRR